MKKERKAQFSKKMLIKNNLNGFWAHVFQHLNWQSWRTADKASAFFLLAQRTIHQKDEFRIEFLFFFELQKRERFRKLNEEKRQEANKWA